MKKSVRAAEPSVTATIPITRDGDRHCPKCQAAKQAFWIDDLVHTTLPVKHYHLVFTVPHHLNVVCLHNQRMYYDLLFQQSGKPSGRLATRILVLKPGPWPYFTPGGKTSRCTRTSIAWFPLPDIPWMDGGKTSAIPVTIFIRYTN